MLYTMDMNDGVVRVTFSGKLTKHDLLELAQPVKGIGESATVAPYWLIDMRPLTNMDIDYGAISQLDRAMRSRSLLNTVRVALLAGSPIQYGFARMFQMLMGHPQVTVELFENERDALGWLSNQTK